MAKLAVSAKVFFGKDSVCESKDALLKEDLNRIIFVVDKNIAKVNAVLRLIESFKVSRFDILDTEVFDASCEPTYDSLDLFTEKLRKKNADALIAIGGGSVMDIVKGAAILLNNPGKGIDYRGMDKVKSPGIPVVCFPTTAGTGSEVTHTASFIDKQTMTKLGINGRYVAPLFGVLYPNLLFSCPDKVTKYSGLDAMVHAIEAVSSKNATIFTRAIGSKAFAMLFENIKRALSIPDDYETRENMLLASCMAGIAMMNAGGGPASGISYPLGTHFNVPHGIAGGIFLPHVFEYNIQNGYHGYCETYDLLADADLSLSDEEKSQDFVMKFKCLYKDINAPEKLTAFGICKKDAERLAEITIKERKQNLELNPVPFEEKDVHSLLEKLF